MKDYSQNRKKLRLSDYDYAQAGAYFITICVNDKETYLSTIVESQTRSKTHTLELSAQGLIVQTKLRQLIGLSKFVIMPDHIHLMFIRNVSEPFRSIPYTVRYFKRQVTEALGRSIWQKSYYDVIVRDQAQYQTVWNYIEKNPYVYLNKITNAEFK